MSLWKVGGRVRCINAHNSTPKDLERALARIPGCQDYAVVSASTGGPVHAHVWIDDAVGGTPLDWERAPEHVIAHIQHLVGETSDVRLLDSVA